MDEQTNEIIERIMADCGMTRQQAEVEFDLECFSDFYKSVHGIRPRFMYEAFRAMSDEQRKAEFASLEAYCNTPQYKAQTLADEEYYRQQEAECAAERAAYFAAIEAREAEAAEDRANYWTLSEVLEQHRGWL